MFGNRSFKDLVAITADVHAVGTVTGATIDRQGFDGYAHFLFDFGTPGASATADAKIQESDDDSTYADVPADGAGTSCVLPQQTTASGRKRLDVKLRKRKRYLQAVVVVAVQTYDLGCWCILTGQKNEDAAVTPDVDHGFQG
jgi:hypothetical protein